MVRQVAKYHNYDFYIFKNIITWEIYVMTCHVTLVILPWYINLSK